MQTVTNAPARHRDAGEVAPAEPERRRAPRTPRATSIGEVLRWSIAALLMGAAGIHFAMMGEHAGVSWTHGVFFAFTAWLQVALAVGVIWRPSRLVVSAVVVVNVAILAVWILTRTVGIAIGGDGTPEAWGTIDGVCAALEGLAILAAIGLLVPRFSRRPLSAGVGLGGVAFVAIAIAAIVTFIFSPSAVAGGGTSADGHNHGGAGSSADGHNHGAVVDDRGFAALANGEQHSHGFTQAVSKADSLLLGHQLELARQVALQYPTVADAEAAGLHRAGPFSPGLGAHYINYANAGGAPGGVMTDDAIRKPLAWMYSGTHPDSRVIGLFYASAIKDPPGFAGPNDTWHTHKDTCIRQGPTGIEAPLGADHGATKKECDAVGGFLLKQTQNLLHTWVVPGWESPEGIYAHLSSAVTCADGTYKTIKDVTKIGARSTICADGAE